MKSYVDFISDIAADATLLAQLERAAPFSCEEHLQRWFLARGYVLSAEDVATLFDHQRALLDETAQVTY